jgi:hypothetical protein
MINIHPKGRLGNQMFQYCLARIISEQLDYATDMELPFKNAKILKGKIVKSPVEQLNGHEIDLKGVLSNKKNRRIYLNGYFQQYEYYKDYKKEIQKWFEITEGYKKPGINDLVVHVRGGDLYNKGGNTQHTPCPLSYYTSIIQQTYYRRLFIVTENPDDIIVQAIQKRHSCKIISQSVIEDYYFMFHATKLVLSVCTIAWWAGWLGNATEVHYPLLGYWHHDSVRNEINLRVSEQRYIYYDLGVQDNWQASDEQIENLLK